MYQPRCFIPGMLDWEKQLKKNQTKILKINPPYPHPKCTP